MHKTPLKRGVLCFTGNASAVYGGYKISAAPLLTLKKYGIILRFCKNYIFLWCLMTITLHSSNG